MKIKPFHIVVNPVGSKFAKTLQSTLRAQVVNPVYRRRQPKPGRSYFAVTLQPLNKVEQLYRFTAAGISCPAFCTSVDAIPNLECKTVFARQLINATNGRGIVEFAADATEIPRAPLYTEYIPKKAEYRVHVFKGEVIDVQAKRKKRGFESTRNTRVRNVDNGYVYCRDGVTIPAGGTDLAVRAVEACGYDYGAVDLIYNEKRNQCFVLEVNSRPGLMGTTLQKYTNAIVNNFGLVAR